MNLTEFAEARNVKINAVSNYLSRHPEIKKHTVRIGKETELTPQAIDMLDSVYPLPKPIQIMTGVDPDEHKRVQTELEIIRKKYDATLEKITVLQDKMMEDQKLLAQAEAQKILLEDRESQLKIATEEGEKKDTEIDLQKKKIEEQNRQLEELKNENERLKNRSLFERIFNK